MKSSILIEDLLGFVDQPQRSDLAAGIRNRDVGIISSLDAVLIEAAAFYDELFEREGPQAGNHYAWLNVELGNYYLAVGLKDKASESFYEAWKNFANPQVIVKATNN